MERKTVERKTESTGEGIRTAGTSAKGVKKGDKVRHAVFGEGIVVRVEGSIAQIAFPYPAGMKKIAAAHPSLKKVKK